MRKFFVYYRQPDDRIAVVSGFAWMPLFFGPLWLAYKGLWLRAAAVLFVLVILGTIGSIFEKMGFPVLSLILTIFQLMIYASLSVLGNEWVCKKHLKSGYMLEAILDAASSEEAVSLSKKQNSGFGTCKSPIKDISAGFERIEPSYNVLTNSDSSPQHATQNETPPPIKIHRPQPAEKRIFFTILKIVGGLLLVIGALAAAGIGKLVGKTVEHGVSQSVSSSVQPSNDSEVSLLIAKAVSETNKKLPATLEGGFVAINARAGDGNQIVYEYTIPNNITLAPDFKTKQSAQLRKAYCNNMKPMISLGISAQWRYKHRDETYIFNAKPSDC